MEILLGVDTLTYHCRLEQGEIALEAVVKESKKLGADFVQLNAYHLRTFTPQRIRLLRSMADGLGLGFTLSGDVVGLALRGDTVSSGVERLGTWSKLARRLGSPFVRVSSGFYRNELLDNPAGIRTEQKYVIDVLKRATDETAAGLRVLLENHSDFTPEEYVEIVEQVGPDRVGVFLDLINPVALLLEPLPVIQKLAPWASAGHAKDYRLQSKYVEDGFHRRGFEVQYCYPGEGSADLQSLVGVLKGTTRTGPYHLSIEGLDNYAGVADQPDRLSRSLDHLRNLLSQD